ncbi:SEC23-like transport protein [Chloropicon primus]|uniref:Protein transport protein SEC23 n=2 Tax=Chloropicon primus TaxID=1764295 RepID=A0A5B8N012_9CHLO|nr:SEC23-like transport protein [Chloropicon primus]UPR05330.1 SEC23-like transport protein [Chloropicon primus]|eukprot:QDZ26113.1 SEC23-like transport protein [Chloropicon primus]
MTSSSSCFQEEERTGVRFSWNVWPTSRIEASRITVPFGAMYTPLKHAASEIPCAPYEPLACKQCGGIVNPHCRINFEQKTWMCVFCHTSNNFPSHYAGMSESCLPAELFPGNEVIEYQLPQRSSIVPTFLFVVDTMLEPGDLRAAVVALQHSLELIPQYAHVGLVTFGEMVQVYELGFQQCSKHFLLRGDADHSRDSVMQMLDLGVKQQKRQPQVNGQGKGEDTTPAERFFPSLSDCEFNLSAIVDVIETDQQDKRPRHRPLRCTGAAMAVAVALTEICMPTGGCKICLFSGGACTFGPGKIVQTDLSCHYRTHHDFDKGSGPAMQLFGKSATHYEGLGVRLVQSGNSCDLFACSLDQVGAAEMYSMMEQTGGNIILSESFEHHVFRESLKKVFERKDGTGDLEAALSVEMEIKCSQEIKVSGLIGAALGMGKDSNLVSEIEIGEGRTVRWKAGTANKFSTYAIYFDIVMQHTDGQQQQQSLQTFHMQFVTEYTHSRGQKAMRVTTVTRRWAPPGSPEIGLGFDQESAAVLMARMAISRVEEGQDIIDTIRWLDRMLVTLCAKFGSYNSQGPHNFHLPQQFRKYPELMYHLRRSQVLQVFNNSPDETVFFRLALKKEGTYNSLLIMQPQLFAYSFENDGRSQPVPLDATSVAADRILVLDTFFVVLVHYGTTIVQWRNEGYQDKEEYAGFKAMLRAPRADAHHIAGNRLPYPKIVECNQNGSQARFLLAKLNPSVTYASGGQVLGGEAIRTDDVNMETFLEHLGRLVAAQRK